MFTTCYRVRLTHVRIDFPTRNVDILHVYQHAASTDPSCTIKDKRRRLFNRFGHAYSFDAWQKSFGGGWGLQSALAMCFALHGQCHLCSFSYPPRPLSRGKIRCCILLNVMIWWLSIPFIAAPVSHFNTALVEHRLTSYLFEVVTLLAALRDLDHCMIPLLWLGATPNITLSLPSYRCQDIGGLPRRAP